MNQYEPDSCFWGWIHYTIFGTFKNILHFNIYCNHKKISYNSFII